MFTFISCSFKENLLNIWTALSASLLVLMVTKANPFDSPFLWSVMRSAMMTSPARLNRAVNSCRVIDFGRLPTYNLTLIFYHALFFEGNNRRPIKGMAA